MRSWSYSEACKYSSHGGSEMCRDFIYDLLLRWRHRARRGRPCLSFASGLSRLTVIRRLTMTTLLPGLSRFHSVANSPSFCKTPVLTSTGMLVTHWETSWQVKTAFFGLSPWLSLDSQSATSHRSTARLTCACWISNGLGHQSRCSAQNPRCAPKIVNEKYFLRQNGGNCRILP